MDKAYLTKFSDGNLKDLLVDRDNIPSLEYLLDEEGQRLERLQKLEKEGKLDFGPKVRRRDLNSLFSNIKDEVDSFLGVFGINLPEHKYFSLLKPGLRSIRITLDYTCGYYLLFTGILGLSEDYLTAILQTIIGFTFIRLGKTLYKSASQSEYNRQTKSINLPKEKRAELIPTIAHEYTHHVQKRSMNLQNKNLESVLELASVSFIEGHARGVERHVSNTYRKKEDNEAFLYHITDETLGELKSAYQWICEKLSTSSKKSLLKQSTSRDKEETYSRKKLNQPTLHAIGNTLFYLYETQTGNKIYKNLLNRTFKLPN